MSRYFITEFPFEFEDKTPIVLTKSFRIGVLRKVPHGDQGFNVFVEGVPGGDGHNDGIVHLDRAMVAKLEKGGATVWLNL